MCLTPSYAKRNDKLFAGFYSNHPYYRFIGVAQWLAVADLATDPQPVSVTTGRLVITYRDDRPSFAAFDIEVAVP